MVTSLPPVCAESQADPDGAVAAGRAYFEHAPGVGRADQHAQESAVLFGDRQLALVGGPDACQKLGDTRINGLGAA